MLTVYFTFKHVWCSLSFLMYCLSARSMWRRWGWCVALCLYSPSLHPLVVLQPPLVHFLLPYHLHCTQTHRCHWRWSLTCHLQSRSKPQPRGRCTGLVPETGIGLLWETKHTLILELNLCLWPENI